MILRVEKQRQVAVGSTSLIDNSAMQIRVQDTRRDSRIRGNGRRRRGADRQQLYCDNCEKIGHLRETSFKLHGFPNWYKELGDQRKRRMLELDALEAKVLQLWLRRNEVLNRGL